MTDNINKDAQAPTPDHKPRYVGGELLLPTEEAVVVSRGAFDSQVVARHTESECIAYGRRKGNGVMNRALDPTRNHTDADLIFAALNSAK